jgi:hypothetical protein
VTLRARSGSVRPCQRETGGGIVIKRRCRKSGSRMADGAVHWKTSLHVVGICSGIKLSDVASIAILGCTGKSTARVALVALQRHVSSSERELRFRVIKDCISPSSCGMALSTIR